MQDPLNLSLWLRGFSSRNMLDSFERLLSLFPFSGLRPGVAGIKIYAIEYAEPVLLEEAFTEETEIGTAMDICREFESPDCVYSVDGYWDLWRFDKGWNLTPVRVTLSCFGPEFDNEVKDHLRLELGPESDFLPVAGAPQAQRKAQSNLVGIVRLAHDLEQEMPVERRSLWSESGENFADRLDDAFFEEAG
jgi:hypothetical protein